MALAALLLAGCTFPASRDGAPVPPGEAPGALVAAVVSALERDIPDLPVDRAERTAYRTSALTAVTPAEERAIARELIERVPSSHIALFSGFAKLVFEAELAGRDAPTIGFTLAGVGGELFVAGVLRGTAAEGAGLRRGDRLVAIDGIAAAASPRLDDRHDDAAPPDEEERLVRVAVGDSVRVRIERRAATWAEIEVELPVAAWSSLRSDRLGARIVERDGVRVGILPLSYIYSRETTRLLLDALAGPLAGAEALLLDVRGRGGSAIALAALVSVLRNPAVAGELPIVLAIDRRTRSAKEVLARELRAGGRATLVGERTSGAVRPARWVPLVRDTWLLCPRGPLARDPYGLEGRGVEPDIAVDDPFPGGDGADPILEAAMAEAARQALGRRAETR